MKVLLKRDVLLSVNLCNQRVRWPLHPPPVEGESVLSWLGRIARGYRMDLKNLLISDLGFDGALKSLIIRLSPDLLSLLSLRTGLFENDIQALTLSTWSPLLLDDLGSPSADFTGYVDAYPLFFPLKNRHKTHRPKRPWWPWLCGWNKAIIKACPRCVLAGPTGVILLVWHLSILLSCPIHGCMLRYCKTYQGSFMCWVNKALLISDVPQAIAVMDKRTWTALTSGRVDLPGRAVHGAVWLRLLRALVDELHLPASGKRCVGAGYIMAIWDLLGLGSRADMRRWRLYELLPNEIQDKTLLAAAIALHWLETGRISVTGEQALWFVRR